MEKSNNDYRSTERSRSVANLPHSSDEINIGESLYPPVITFDSTTFDTRENVVVQRNVININEQKEDKEDSENTHSNQEYLMASGGEDNTDENGGASNDELNDTQSFLNHPFQLKSNDSPFTSKNHNTAQFQLDHYENKSDSRNNSIAPFNPGLTENPILNEMGQYFGADFSTVNIHTDVSEADTLGAQAFTIGNEISFAPEKYDPESMEGRSLIGHELTHVVQQRQGRVNPTRQMKGFSLNDDANLEKEADEVGRKAARGEQLPFNIYQDYNSSNTSIQRSTIQRELSETELNSSINALHNIENQHNAVRILREKHEDLEQIKTAFQNEYDIILRSYIRDNYSDTDMKIKATALLFDPTYDLPWTRLALTLIPLQTREEEFFRILLNESDSARADNRRKYNARFVELGEGSLDADIRADFEGVEETRAWITSYRNPTDADNIYLMTAGQYGTDVPALLATLRRIWGYGINIFDNKLRQWNPNNNLPDVESGNSAPSSYFENLTPELVSNFERINANGRSLMFTVLTELSGDPFDNAEAIFIEYVRQKGRSPDQAQSETTGWAFTQQEESDLRVARARLSAAEDIVTETDEVNSATAQIIEVYEQRVARLQRNHATEEDIQHARELLRQTQDRLSRDHDVNPLLTTERNYADEVYLLRHDQNQMVEKILFYFKEGHLSEFKTQAREPHTENNEELRPAFDPQGLLRLNHLRGGRMYNLLGRSSESEGGAYYIHDTIDREYVQYVTMNYLHSLINTGPWLQSLKDSVLMTYINRHAPRDILNRQGYNLNSKFVLHMYHLGFRRFSNWPSFRDALAPPQSDEERVARARQDLETEESNTIGNLATTVSDVLTGDDTREVAHTSLDMLERFARRAHASSSEMEAFRAHYGDELDLVSREYSLFQERLGDIRQARNTMASTVNSVISTVIEAALSPFITPAGAAIAGQVIGILSEWAINPESEPISQENLQSIIVAAVSAGASSWTDSDGVIGGMLERRITNQYLRSAAEESINQSFEQLADGFCAGLQGNLDRRDIMSRIESMLAASIASGAVSRMNIDRIKNDVIRNAFEGMAEQIISEGVSTAQALILHPDDNGGNISDRIARAAVDALLEGVIGEIAENRSRNRENASSNQDADQETNNTHDRETNSHRDAILPPAPSDTRRVPPAPPGNNNNDHDHNGPDDHRDTEYDLPTTNTLPSPENHEPPDYGHSDTLPASPNIENRDTIPDAENNNRDTVPEGETRDTIPESSNLNQNNPRNTLLGLNHTPESLNSDESFNQTFGNIPNEATIVQADPNYVIYAVNGQQRIRFVSDSAVTLQEATPGSNNTPDSLCGLNERNQPYVLEGRHRAVGSSQGHIVHPSNGGIDGHPGVLDYPYTNEPQTGGIPVSSLEIDDYQHTTAEEANLLRQVQEDAEMDTLGINDNRDTDSDVNSNPTDVDNTNREHRSPHGDIIDRVGNVEYDIGNDHYIIRERFAEDINSNGILNTRYQATARIENGTVTFDLSLREGGHRSGHIRGAEFYRNALANFRIQGHTVQNIKSEFGDGDNLATFREREALYINQNYSPEDAAIKAASETWSGRNAIDNDFKRISITRNDADGVEVIFERGESNVPQ